MLRNAKLLDRCELRATDGVIGEVKDVYFDDHAWHVRYLVVSTGSWLSGRMVLISPAAVTTPDLDRGDIGVNLTKEQVRNSPGVDTDRPVSRQQELELHSYYGWPYYWTAPMLGGGYVAPMAPGVIPTAAAAGSAHSPESRSEEATRAETAGAADVRRAAENDPHLRSAHAVRGYRIEASDGSIGHVEDLLIEDRDWAVRYILVDTRNWWPGKKVIVAPSRVESISWADRTAHVGLNRQTIQESPEFDPARPISAEYTDRLEAHYDRYRGSGKAPSSSGRAGSRPR